MDKLEFMPVDVSCLPEALVLKLQAYKALEEKATEAKKDFEADFVTLLNRSGDIPDGMSVVFGYRFGGLAIAFKPIEAKKQSGKPMFVVGATKNAPVTKGGKPWKK